MTPPALRIGSAMTAAGRLVKFASASSRLAFRHRNSHFGKLEATGHW